MATWTASAALAELGLGAQNPGVFDGEAWGGNGPVHSCVNPTTGEVLAEVRFGDKNDYERCVSRAVAAQDAWQRTPAPKRGEVVRLLGNALREKKEALGALLSLEMGKIHSEGMGEVQEFIDICDLACGMSRQLPGQVLASERESHTLLETWHPLGTVGIITAFNFPHAVFGWNACVSLVCGNTQVVKGAESASLVSIATQKILNGVLADCGVDGAVATLCQGEGGVVGEAMLRDERVGLVSFTGSTLVGQHANEVVASRFGRSILELGGNNAVLVMPSADLDMAVRSATFAAAGTAGQRCTSLRRLLLHADVYDDFVARLVKAYAQLPMGSPLDPKTLVGPVHNQRAVDTYHATLAKAAEQGGTLLAGGGSVQASELPEASMAGGFFVKPAVVAIDADAPVVQEENFVPVLYVCKVGSFEEGVKVNNQVEQGLTSALFSNDMREVFEWVGPRGSDTGIINVNTSCSGAEIGGAFGGNKKTGGGRESGSTAWQQYMRRGTCTINFGKTLPLAQGVEF